MALGMPSACRGRIHTEMVSLTDTTASRHRAVIIFGRQASTSLELNLQHARRRQQTTFIYERVLVCPGNGHAPFLSRDGNRRSPNANRLIHIQRLCFHPGCLLFPTATHAPILLSWSFEPRTAKLFIDDGLDGLPAMSYGLVQAVHSWLLRQAEEGEWGNNKSAR